MRYKLGLDLGSTSLGWAVAALNEKDEIVDLVDLGVRIFPDGRDAKTHTPINVNRRDARTARRRGDRVKLRKDMTMKLIEKYGLGFQINEKLENPYKLRAAALGRKLSPDELGRVLFHLALRRGFKSNRKETRGEDGGKLKQATLALQTSIGDKTLGQWQNETGKYRFSNQFDGDKIKDGAFYPTRKMYEDEFKAIFKAQEIDDKTREEFYDAIFFQRPLKPQDVGNCMFEEGEPRAYKFYPAFQKWRALQQLNQLAILENGKNIPLTDEQQNAIRNTLLDTFNYVNKKGKLTFAKIRSQLKIKSKFNLESEKRDSLDADKTGFAMSQIGADDFWRGLKESEQNALLDKINNDQIEDEEIVAELTRANIDQDLAEQIANISLEDGTASVSLKAIDKMLPFLEAGQMYDKAAESAGYHHSNKNVPQYDNLPYYGDLALLRPSLVADKYGRFRVMNATVHIALNQIRAVVNELIGKYGKPAAVNIEMGRDVREGAQGRKEIDIEQAKNKRYNDEIRKELAAIGIANPSREDFQKYKLWEMLAKNPVDRRCVYTGQQISLTDLYTNKFEIEHILPFAQTLDDSIANKTVSAVEANRFKGNRTPFDAFNDPKCPDDWKYEKVWERAQNLPDNAKWRFKETALADYLRDNDCIARALNDTRHMSRLAVWYLQHICKDKNNVAGLPGRMTALFRDMWSLDWWKNKEELEKERYRAHHIHHAIDAFVIACMGRGQLQKLATNADSLERFGKNLKEKRKNLFANIDVPFDGFNHFDFFTTCENTIISYRQSHKNPRADGTIGRLHEDTAYSLVEFTNGTKATFCVSESVPDGKDEKTARKFFSNINKTTLDMFMVDTGVLNDDANMAQKFIEWCNEKGHKKIRMHYKDIDATTYIPIFRNKPDRENYYKAYEELFAEDGVAAGMTDKKAKAAQKAKEHGLLEKYRTAAMRAYKWFVGGNNFCAEIYEIRKDDKKYPKLRGTWQIEVMSNFDAMRARGEPLWRKKYPTAKRIMTLRRDDMVIAEFDRTDEKLPKGIIDAVNAKADWEKRDKVEIIFRVKKLNSSGIVYLRPHFIAKEDADTKSWGASASSLQEHNARKINISPTGKILK